MKKIVLAVWVGLALSAARGEFVPFEGEKSSWREGFERFDFEMDEVSLEITPFKRPEGEKFAVGAPAKGKRRCVVVAPKTPAPGYPWSWQGCYWDHEPQTEVELLRRGFHIVFISSDPGKQWDAWYEYLTKKHGLCAKPAFVGMSRGGINEYDWATANPDKVSVLYADNPAIRAEAFNKLGELVKNDVALINVCGSQDNLLQKNTLPIEERYRRLGGLITVIVKDGPGHHPHSLRNPKPIADFIVEHMKLGPAARPEFADESFVKGYFYSDASTNVFLKEEKIFANCRGPGFVPSYERYDARTASQWGVIGMSVIVPRRAAEGKPWAFRVNAITRDAAVDLELLARGFHIVIPPLTAQSGPVAEQWEATYQLMTKHGFAKKVALEGLRTGAGEAYAWAIDNAEKVSCVVAENPVLRSLISKKAVLENLEPLAKAGIPLLHVCDKSNPWLEENTGALRKKYEGLGGSLTVIMSESDGRYPLTEAEAGRVADFVVERSR